MCEIEVAVAMVECAQQTLDLRKRIGRKSPRRDMSAEFAHRQTVSWSGPEAIETGRLRTRNDLQSVATAPVHEQDSAAGLLFLFHYETQIDDLAEIPQGFGFGLFLENLFLKIDQSS